MHIANVDALKEWLSKTLAPICDADPTTLSRYVLALLKKDKSLSELHSVCLQELEVFLLSKTKDFVELLFTTLENGSYDHNRPKTTIQPASSAAPPSGGNLDAQKSRSPEWQLSSTSVTLKATVKSDTMAAEPVARSSIAVVTAPLARSDRHELSRTKSTSDRRSRSRDRGMISQLGSTSSRVHRKMSSTNEENHRPQTSRLQLGRSRNRNHSRERSRERRVPISRRLGYQGSRNLRRHVDSIHSRIDRHSRDDRSHRRRSRSRSWRAGTRSRSRSRSWSRLRSSPLMRVRSQMRAYSRSKTRSKSRSPLSAVQNPSSPPVERSPKRASRSLSSEGRDENAYRIKVPLDVVLSSKPPPSTHLDALSDRAGGPSQFPAKVAHQPPPCPRCRDYDEKGFCLRGNLCPFDHGSDPLIFDDENIPGIVTFPGSQPGPLRHPPPLPSAAVRPLPPMPPVLVPSPLLVPPAPGVPLMATGVSMIPPVPAAPGRNLMPTGILMDPNYSPALNSTSVMKTDAAVPMEASVAVSENSVIPVLPKDSGDGKRIVIPARRQVNLGVSQSSFPDNQEAPEIQDVRLVVRQGGRPLEPILSNDERLSFPKKPISSRLGTRKAIVSEENSTLALTGVPVHLNTISSINQELSKYGTIVNIQVHYNGQSDRALVSFARHADAAAAFNSSEPVFNNRFVSLFWHSTDRPASVPEVRKLSVKERLGIRPGPPGIESSSVVHQPRSSTPQQLANNGMVKEELEKRLVVLSPSGALTKTLFNKIPPSANTSASSKVLDNRKPVQSKSTSNLNDLNKEQMKMKLEIAKQKQLLMKKHVEQQKALLVKLESHSLSSEEKKSLIQRMKLLERRLEKMKSELQDSASSLQPLVKSIPAAALTKISVNHQPLPPKTVKSRLEMQKSILDAELDLIAKENQGIDTTDIKKSVAILKSQAAAQWLPGSTRGLGRGFRGRGAVRGGTFARRGRGTAHLSHATKLIDRRPKQLVVSGFFPSDMDQIIASIAKFNSVEGTEIGPGDASILITFSSRLDAEKAALEGLKFQDRKLLMSWFDARKSAPKLEEKKEEEEEEMKQDVEDEEAEEEEEEVEQEKEVALEDSESEVELIVEDDDEKEDDDEELSGHVTIALDEDEVLDDSELLRLEEEDEDAGLLDQSWQR